MDLIFHRYADPYTLLEYNDREPELLMSLYAHSVRIDDDDKLWDMYIHKCWENISFNAFKAKIYGVTLGDGSQQNRSGAFESRDELEATIKDSMSIIENFKP